MKGGKIVSSYDDHDNHLIMMTTMMNDSTTKTAALDGNTAKSGSQSDVSGSNSTMIQYDSSIRCPLTENISNDDEPHQSDECQQTTRLEDDCTQSMEFQSSLLIARNQKFLKSKELNLRKKWINYLMVVSKRYYSIVIGNLTLTGCLIPNGCNILAGKKNEVMMNNKLSKRGCCSSQTGASNNNNSLLISIMLPFLLIFLLPSFKLEIDDNKSNMIIVPSKTPTTTTKTKMTMVTNTIEHTTLPIMSELLLSLLKFPFDRLRLNSIGFVNCVEAKEINMNHNSIIYRPNDLQEEETHMLIMAPAEHRSSFLAPTQQIPAGYQQISRSNQRLQEHSTYQGGPMETGVQMAPQVAPLPQAQLQLQPPQIQNQADLHNGASDYANGPLGGESGGSGEGLQGVGSVEGGPESSSASQGGSLASSSASSGLQTRGDLPVVRALNVKCEKNHMTVNIVFDRPFYGMVFSKGHYNDQKCVHLPANSGQTSVNFDIHLGKCGMSSSDAGATGANQLQQTTNAGQQQQQPNGLYIENVIIIQYDPQVQEIYDQARKLRCTWYDYYEKSVTFRPYNVDMHDAVTANFLGDNIQCWMQIQVGKGPWSNEVAGIVKIGQTMTMVLAIKDDENRFDMLVRNCVAHDGKHQPIQLVDEYGCVARPKIMAKFQKVRNFGPAATVVSYAHFQAFKFPDSMSVHFQCVIQVCRYECPEPVCNGRASSNDLPNANGAAVPNALSVSGTDYAASGTELVASKEVLPSSNHGLQQQHPSSIKMVAPSQHSSNAANLKLDESQGRVQVKLDTSMIAGAHQQAQRAPHNGPLPPHLLHTVSAGASQETSGQPPAAQFAIGRGGHTFMSSSFTGTNSKPSLGATTGGANMLANGRPSSIGSRSSAVAPSNGMQSMHYSSPYPQVQRSGALAYVATNRLGDLPLGDGTTGNEDEVDSTKPLVSLFGSPRALLSTPNISSSSSSSLSSPIKHPASNHRYRRSIQVNNTTSLPSTQPRVSAKNVREVTADQDSTAIKTQKTIQVVSPDDVAFSLLSDQLEPLTISGPQSVARNRPFYGPGEDLSTVCFSATRLITAILVTLILVATSIVIVTFVILRQRSINRLEESNLSPIYERDDSPALSIQDNHDNNHQLNRQTINKHYHLRTNSNDNGGSSKEFYDEDTVGEIMSRRQREEIQQRNNYLARLYSQFSPATYWR